LTEKDHHHSHTHNDNNIDVRYIEQAILDTRATILVVDKKVSLVMELRDDSKTTFDEAIGLSTYSNSKGGVLSYVAIFENLWKQTELYEDVKRAHEQLKMHDRMQKEFNNIAAHELRTPIQPILGEAEYIEHQFDHKNKVEVENEQIALIIRNAKRLERLASDILDVSKIESQSLRLNKEQFNLNHVLSDSIQDIRNRLATDNGYNNAVEVLYKPEDIIVEADKGRITRVISNLLNNAVKFTKEGVISVIAQRRDSQV